MQGSKARDEQVGAVWHRRGKPSLRSSNSGSGFGNLLPISNQEACALRRRPGCDYDAVVGANGSIGNAISTAPSIFAFAFAFVQVAVHLLVTLGVGTLLGLDRKLLLVASAARPQPAGLLWWLRRSSRPSSESPSPPSLEPFLLRFSMYCFALFIANPITIALGI